MLSLFIILALMGLAFWAGYIARGLVSRRRHAEYLQYEPYLPPRSGSSVASSNGDIIRSLHGAPVNVHPADSPPLNAVDTWADIEELVRRSGFNKVAAREIGRQALKAAAPPPDIRTLRNLAGSSQKQN
jgi:hypothetical protein